MKINKRVRRDAKRMFRLCLVGGLLDEARAREVVRRVNEEDRRDRWVILRYFSRLVKRDRDRHTATVESAAPLPTELQSGVQRDLSRRYGAGLTTSFTHRPELIGGMRIRVGSDVYDGSVQAGLAALERSF
jgi:F-type H+-transporting ATPase subunit delta